MSSDTAV